MEKPARPRALYEQIKQQITREIDAGRLKPDDKVPSETRLAKAFKASRMTANRALKELTEEGRIIRIQGVGTFVARPKPDAALLEIRSIAREIADWGGIHSCEVLLLAKETVTPDIGEKMDLAPGTDLFHSIVLHKDRGVGVQYSERFINPAVAPDYLAQDFVQITPSDYLLQVAPVQEAEHVIEAVRCPFHVRSHLQISAAEPCLCLTRRTWSFDRVATFSTMISPGFRYKLKGKFNKRVSQ
ncbi:MAG: histidine utilization repressor [Desulfotignum sp.]|nr:histidine utilization repressor [Desulfotignum sp.]MCF8114289.1 histidine utilization repressor [Desulfotignum sp.]MCF8125968.1 histidine utilization repressor [Desulfotignum sp.]